MIAQKLNNNRIAISSGNVARKDAIQIIEDLKVGEFFRLSRAARNWDKNLNDRRDIMFTTYENEHSKVCKEFDDIYSRRKLFAERLNNRNEAEDLIPTETIPTKSVEERIEERKREKKPPLVWASSIKGTSRLLRIPKKQIIKIVRRKGLIDDNNRPNSVCIDNRMREEFFADCKKTQYFQNLHESKKYEIMYNEEDKELYEKWDSIITNMYEKGLPKSINREVTAE